MPWYTWWDEQNKACTLLYIPVGIHDTVHIIKWEEYTCAL
jgi:hypothetical protein